MSQNTTKLPHWDLSNVYSGLDSKDFKDAVAEVERRLDTYEKLVADGHVGRLDAIPDDLDAVAATMTELIDFMNETNRLMWTVGSYISSFVTTDSYDKLAAKEHSAFAMLNVRSHNTYVLFEAWVGSLEPVLDQLCAKNDTLKEHRQFLIDTAEESRYRMTPELEELAADLMLSGAGKMNLLQSTVTSQLKIPFELDGKTEMMPMTMVRNLANNPSEDVRRRAYEAELAGWEQIREPVAFALNSVKGAAITLCKRRGREDVLHSALDNNKIDRETLEALLASMHDSFPAFRRYFRSKAKKLGKDALPWWDLFAPVGEVELSYTWEEVRDYIVEQFGTFSDEMASFAATAFEKDWIDAEPRDGKVGGAFCMRVPGVDESRILANFDGSFDQMSTLAHELGHGFHNHCQVGLPILRQGSPSTLAETASIFCQTIVINAALKAAPAEAQLGILENQLMDAAQVIVDIYSRFIFESEIVKRREKADLSADEFCELMLDAQRQTYGDGLDQEHLHPYMWLLKPHYYSQGYNFYNFPYAFGMLFGLGVYALYLKEGEAFLPRYKELLRSTGEGKAADIASRYGIDIRSRDFWDASIKVLSDQIDRYCELDG